jgi:hypothetical protein
MAEERGGSVPLHLLPQPEWTARHCPRCPRLTLPLSRVTVTGVHGIGRGGSRAGRRTGRGLALEAEMEQAGAPAAGRLDCRSEYTPPSPTEPWLATPLPLPRWRRLSWRAHYGRGPRGCDPASSYTQLSPPAPWPAMRPPQRLLDCYLARGGGRGGGGQTPPALLSSRRAAAATRMTPQGSV